LAVKFPTKGFNLSLSWRLYNCNKEYLVNGEKIRKGMEGRNDSHCVLFLLLAFAFYKELYFVGIFVSSSSSSSSSSSLSSFIGAN